jgi:hypothetical protein
MSNSAPHAVQRAAQLRVRLDDQDTDDVGMRNPQTGQQGDALASVLGNHQVDVGIRQCADASTGERTTSTRSSC